MNDCEVTDGSNELNCVEAVMLKSLIERIKFRKMLVTYKYDGDNGFDVGNVMEVTMFENG